jgi:hypothetical protein
VLLALLAGCGKPPGPTAAKTPPGPADGPSPAKPDEPPPFAAAAGFARDFLRAANAGTATPDQLTAAFKTLVAPPVFPSDEPQGYSDAAAADWLAGWKGKLPATAPVAAATTADAAVFAGPGVGLRVAKEGGGWRADGLFPAAGPLPTGDAAFPGFAAAAFLHAVAAKDDRMAAALMTPGLRARLAPPFGSDRGGFNRGLLGQRLADLRGTATGYALARADAGTAAGELTGPDGARRAVTLKLAKGERAWDWLVDEYRAE